MTGHRAPKPANWDALVAAWNNPAAFRREEAVYGAQVAADQASRRGPLTDITQPRRPIDSDR